MLATYVVVLVQWLVKKSPLRLVVSREVFRSIMVSREAPLEQSFLFDCLLLEKYLLGLVVCVKVFP